MNFRTTLVLLVVAALLGGYVLVFERGELPDKNKPAQVAIFDEKFEAKDLQKIEVTAPDLSVSLERSGEGWKLGSPAGARADKTVADALASDLAMLQASRKIDKAADLASFGLDKPKAKIDFYLPGKTTPRTLLLGEKTVDERSVYAKRADLDAVFLIPPGLATQVEKKTADWRDKNLTGVDFTEVQGLEIEQGGTKMAFEKQGENWKMTSPVAIPASKEQVEGFIRDASGLRVEQFVKDGATADELKGYGLDQPPVRIRLKTGGTTSVELLLGSNEPKPEATPAPTPAGMAPVTQEPAKVYAKIGSEATVCLVPGTLSTRLAKKPEDYYFLKPFTLAQWTAEKAEIRLEERAVVIQKNAKSEWEIAEPAGKKGDYSKISPVLNAAFELNFDGLAPDGSKLEEKARIVVTGEKQGDKPAPTETLLLGAKQADGTRLVQRQGETWVYRMKDSQLDALRTTTQGLLEDPTPPPLSVVPSLLGTPAATPGL